MWQNNYESNFNGSKHRFFFPALFYYFAAILRKSDTRSISHTCCLLSIYLFIYFYCSISFFFFFIKLLFYWFVLCCFIYFQVSFARPSSDSIKFSNLYVSNLPRSMTQQELESMFADFGCIISSKILCNPKAGRSIDVLFSFYII
jgi:hypothetical protein